jgi:hypothetical protein
MPYFSLIVIEADIFILAGDAGKFGFSNNSSSVLGQAILPKGFKKSNANPIYVLSL